MRTLRRGTRKVASVLSNIESLKSNPGVWKICLPGVSGGAHIISKNGHLYDEPTGTEFTEDEICQISCYDEDNGVLYRRVS